MKIQLNGDPKEFPEGTTLQVLLEELRLSEGRVACEVNLQMVRRPQYSQTALKDGDAIEIVQMIGGG